MALERIFLSERYPNRMRPSDVEVLWGDYSKFKEATGWELTIAFSQMLQDILNYWRSLIKNNVPLILKH